MSFQFDMRVLYTKKRPMSLSLTCSLHTGSSDTNKSDSPERKAVIQNGEKPTSPEEEPKEEQIVDRELPSNASGTMAYSLADVFPVTVNLPHQPYKTQVTVGSHVPFPRILTHPSLGLNTRASTRPKTVHSRTTEYISVLLFSSRTQGAAYQ